MVNTAVDWKHVYLLCTVWTICVIVSCNKHTYSSTLDYWKFYRFIVINYCTCFCAEVQPRIGAGHLEGPQSWLSLALCIWSSSISQKSLETRCTWRRYVYSDDCCPSSDSFVQVNHIRNHLRDLFKPDGLYPNFLNPNTGNWGTSKSLKHCIRTVWNIHKFELV